MGQQENTADQAAVAQKIMEKQCPVCQSSQVESVLSIGELPVLANVLWDRREDALNALRAGVTLAFCRRCGHLFNEEYDPRIIDYGAPYENSLHFSPRFQEYATNLAMHLIGKYQLRGKSIVEIGSGKGEFLKMLCQLGDNTGTGFDPSYRPSPDDNQPGITFIADEFSERYAGLHIDFIISRHVLEHIFRPATMLQNLHRALSGNHRVAVFFEVPNLNFILRDTAIWDILYEHYSYFSPYSLIQLFEQNGFAVHDLAETFEGQFLTIEAIPRTTPRQRQSNSHTPSPTYSSQVLDFSRRSREKINHWATQIHQLLQQKKRAVIWGAGSKGISLLNMLNLRDEIPYIIDINPRKHNRYITGTGQQIMPPEFLQSYRPDTIIIMNPIYDEEIRAAVGGLGLQVDYLSAT